MKKYNNNNKTLKFRGGEDPIPSPQIQTPITIGQPTPIQLGEQPGVGEQLQQQGPPPPPQDPTGPPQDPTVPPQEPTVPPQDPTVPPQEPTVPPQEPTVPPQEPTVPPQEPTGMEQPEGPPSEQPQDPSFSPEDPSFMEQPEDQSLMEQPEEPTEQMEKPVIIPVEPLLPPSTEEESEEITEFRKKMEDNSNKRDYFYVNTNISTELNKDKRYKREGVLHFTDSISIKSTTTIGSIVGPSPVENVTYDKLRNTALQKVDILLGENRRCYNTRLEFERNSDSIFIHIYGTLYVKKSL